MKIESCHVGGSIKVKPALAMLQELERTGRLRPGDQVIESSSGNLGVALAGLCRQRGYRFVCVLDSHASPANLRQLRALGARTIICETRDENGGFLAARIAIIEAFLRENPGTVWTNQYDNEANPAAHYRWTAPAILRNRPNVGSVFVGCGTTGTVIGCSRFMRDHAPHVQVVPVDSVGSVTFGSPPGPRYVPGMGSSRRPELIGRHQVGTPVMVGEAEAIRMCRFVAGRYGVLIGGSSGSVLAGVLRYASERRLAGDIVAIAADSGERYLETIFDDEWVAATFPEALGEIVSVEAVLLQ